MNTVDASDFKDLPNNVGHNIFVEQAVLNGNVVEEKFDFTSFTDPHIWKNLTIPLITSNQFFKFSKDEVGVVRCYKKSLGEEPVVVNMLHKTNWRDYFDPAVGRANLGTYVPRIECVALPPARATTILDIMDKFLTREERARWRCWVPGFRHGHQGCAACRCRCCRRGGTCRRA